MRALRSLALLLATALPGSALPAQPAFLVEDINTADVDPASPFGEFAVSGSSVFFVVDDGIHGRELWVSDGTGEGTHVVRDVCRGICSSSPEHLSVLGDQLFFSADDGLTGRQIWKTDGTRDGTARVAATAGGGILEAMAAGSYVFYVRDSTGEGIELWRTDGTDAGTALVKDINPGVYGSDPYLFGAAGGLLFFSAWTGRTGRELWRSDGTEAGTFLVKDFNLDSSGTFSNSSARYPELGGRLCFLVQTAAQGNELWISDGSEAGTVLVKDIMPGSAGSFPNNMSVIGSELYFSASDPDHGWELWKTDGTGAGTVMIADVVPGSGSSYPADISAAGSQIFFRSWLSGEGYELWKTDGTEAGTAKVVPHSTLAFHYDHNVTHGFIGVGGNMLFFGIGGDNGGEPWKSDGTEAGTSMLVDINSGQLASSIGEDRRDRGVLAQGRWFFSAYDAAAGWGLWKSDGTPAGTELVKIVRASTSALEVERPHGFFRRPELFDLDGTLLFGAHDGSYGFELWKSDGTEAGTDFVSDGGLSPGTFTRFQGKAFFTAENPVGYRRVFSSDGTAAGTTRIDADNTSYWGVYGELVPAGDALVFQADSVGRDNEAWKTNGTSAEVLRTTPPSTAWADSFEALGDLAIFQINGSLWRTNGTEAGTVSIATPPSPWAYGWTFTAMGPHVYFTGLGDSGTGFELWRTNGSPGGASLVRDIRPGSLSSFPGNLTAAGGLLFFTADDGTAGVELWKSDGTAPGTARVADIRPGAGSSGIREITAVGSRVFFAADDGVHGSELWVSDGTGAGTHLVEDAAPGQASSHPQFLAAAGSVLVYAADDGTHGLEPWRSDGTEARTFLVQDVAPGETPSSPMSFTLSGDRLFFAANDGDHGFELWALDRVFLGSFLTATKRVLGPVFPGGTVTFEIVITNKGPGSQPDNTGDEMVDVLPAPLVLTGASADVGTASVDPGQNRVAWNGALAFGASAKVTIAAAVPAATGEFQTFFNQATLSFDADGDGAHDASAVSDDPGREGFEQATPVIVTPPALDFHTLTPCRVYDSRSSTPLAAGVARTIPVAGICGIPATARAVAANLTVVNPIGPGYLAAYPAGLAAPATASITFATGQVRSNSVQLGLLGGQADARASYSVHLVVDVSGYYE